jgi:hypothetical protein
MLKNRVSHLAALVVAVLTAGCAHKPVEPAASASQTTAENATPAAAISPSNPGDIVALDKRLIRHRLALYSVTQGKYTFYVGGVLDATYETATEILRISSLTPEDKVDQTCEYSPQGMLFVDPKIHPDKDAYAGACGRLVMRLNDYLSR